VARDFAVVTLLALLSAPSPARKIAVTLPALILSLAVVPDLRGVQPCVVSSLCCVGGEVETSS